MRPHVLGSSLPTVGSLLVLVVACGGPSPSVKSPALPPPPQDLPFLTSIAASCARIAACTRGLDSARYRDPSACAEWWLAGLGDNAEPDTLRRCLSDATTCEGVSSCMLGGGDARAASFCAQRAGPMSGCDGDRLVTCGEDDVHPGSVLDCAAMGASCREAKSAGGLVVRACWSPQKCPAGAPDTRCDGDGAVLSCHDGALERIVCRPGTVCEERADGLGGSVASCVFSNRRTCRALSARRCEEGRLVECDPDRGDGDVSLTDCAGLGLRCAGVGPRAGCYVSTNVECDKERVARCEDESLTFCVAGRIMKVPCANLGLEACDPLAKSPIASCGPERHRPSETPSPPASAASPASSAP